MPSGNKARIALSDEELAGRYRATGDSEYFSELFVRHRAMVYCSCRRFFGDAGLAEDATQETFLRAYEAIERLQEGNVCGWLMRIARNVCIDQWRRRRPGTQAAELGEMGAAEPRVAVNLERTVEMSRAFERVRKEMQNLPAEQRRCLELKMDGYSYEETAGLTGLPLGAVKSHLQNGRRMLWMRLEGILWQLP